MDCKECQENLSPLIDGELAKKQYQTALAHVTKCKSCSDELQSLINLEAFVKERSSTIIPDDSLWDNIAANLKPRKGFLSSMFNFFKIFSLQPVFLKRIEVVLVAAFVLFAFLYFTNSQITINRQEISLRFQQGSPEFMKIHEKAEESLTRRELLLLIQELRKREGLTEEKFYNLSEESTESDDFLFESKTEDQIKEYS